MKNKLRVWYMDRIPSEKALHINVADIQEAKIVINTLIQRDLNDDRITDNVMGLEEFDNKEWIEYYDDEGRCIDEILDEESEE